ncbi:MAG: hypothetical protein R2942_15710 [Ignavibacteria bacterium]
MVSESIAGELVSCRGVTNKPGLNLVRDGIWATDINIRGMIGQYCCS